MDREEFLGEFLAQIIEFEYAKTTLQIQLTDGELGQSRFHFNTEPEGQYGHNLVNIATVGCEGQMLLVSKWRCFCSQFIENSAG